MDRKKILIIDDEEALTRGVKLNLELTGKYVVRIENKGSLGLKAAREFRPDLILLDIAMPDIDGSQVAEQLKDEDNCKNIPIVFLTALVTKKETHESSSDIGGYPFIAKPVSIKNLISCIEENIV
jgi:DNA-binding response OmpR family regulator